MKIDVQNIWYGDVTYIPKEQNIVVKTDSLNYNNNDLLNMAVSFDKTGEGQRFTVRVNAQYDGAYRQTPFVFDLPMTDTGVISIKALRIPQYSGYRTPGKHSIGIQIEVLKNVLGGLLKPVVFSTAKFVDYTVQ